MNESPTPLLFVSVSPTPARGGDDIAEMTTEEGKAPSSSILFFISALPYLTLVVQHLQNRSNVAPNSFDDACAPAELQRPTADVEMQQRRPGQAIQPPPNILADRCTVCERRFRKPS